MYASQIRNYVISNRHNHITAYYYLLKRKVDSDPESLFRDVRSDSPLIFRPDVKK